MHACPTWRGLERTIAWRVGLAAGLVLCLVLMPSYVRIVFWHGLAAHRVLASMLLLLSLVTISLLWSAGQRLDAWAFLFFNLRGSRPLWLDRVMLGFTQIGNGIVGLVVALMFFAAGERLLAYEIALGILTLWLMVELMKALMYRRRPFIRLTQARIVGRRAAGRSFPSGHTSQVFFMATLLVQHFRLGVWAALPPVRHRRCWWALRVCTWARTTRGMCWPGPSWAARGAFWGRLSTRMC